jgi:hypothetical protein
LEKILKLNAFYYNFIHLHERCKVNDAYIDQPTKVREVVVTVRDSGGGPTNPKLRNYFVMMIMIFYAIVLRSVDNNNSDHFQYLVS